MTWRAQRSLLTPPCHFLRFAGVCLSERRAGIWNPGGDFPEQIQVSASDLGISGGARWTVSRLGLVEGVGVALRASFRVTITGKVTFSVTVVEVASLLAPEISVSVWSCLLGGSGMVPHQVVLYSLKVFLPPPCHAPVCSVAQFPTLQVLPPRPVNLAALGSLCFRLRLAP